MLIKWRTKHRLQKCTKVWNVLSVNFCILLPLRDIGCGETRIAPRPLHIESDIKSFQGGQTIEMGQQFVNYSAASATITNMSPIIAPKWISNSDV